MWLARVKAGCIHLCQAQLTLCDPIWQVMLHTFHSSVMGFLFCTFDWTDMASAIGRCNNLPTLKVRWGFPINRAMQHLYLLPFLTASQCTHNVIYTKRQLLYIHKIIALLCQKQTLYHFKYHCSLTVTTTGNYMTGYNWITLLILHKTSSHTTHCYTLLYCYTTTATILLIKWYKVTLPHKTKTRLYHIKQ